jgi:AraC family transcriptional regulator, transcriptional activator FtrA
VSRARDDLRSLSDISALARDARAPHRGTMSKPSATRPDAQRDLRMVAVLVLPDVVAFDLVIAAHVFGDTRPHGGVAKYRMVLCGQAPGLVPMAAGVPIGVQAGLEALAEADTVVVPGRSDADAPVPAPALDALRAAAARGARIVSICTGTFVLAQAGLLAGRRVTTHWGWSELLAARYPDVAVDPRVLYVDDGQVLTSAGMAAGLDLCLHIVRGDHGAEVANAIARRMVVAPHRSGGQAQFIDQPVPVTRDTVLQATQRWVLERLAEPLTVDAMARHANTSARHFTRRFQAEFGITPLRWLLQERVRLAQRLLEQTDLAVQRIAERTGFGSAVALRRHFVEVVGTTPRDYRQTFRGDGADAGR